MFKKMTSGLWQSIRETDWFLLLCCMGLSAFSILLLVSLKLSDSGPDTRALLTQGAMLACGVVAAMILSRIDYHSMAKLWKLHSLVSYGLCLLVFTPLGTQRSEFIDDRAWLQIGGFGFQPSELLKISFILTYAYHLYQVREELNRPKNLLLLCIHGVLPAMIIHFQGDDGTALVLGLMFLMMLFAAGLSWRYIIPAGLMIPPAAAGAWFFLLDDDKRQRIMAILNPELASESILYQQTMGRNAIGNGGLWGNGIFIESGQFRLVPEVHNDFIFSFIGETVGFVGCMAVLGVLLTICLKILSDGMRAADELGKLICVGVFAMIGVQTAINVGMNLSIFPVVGVTLPFLSAGGTSQGTLYLGIGLVLSVYLGSRKNLFFD